MIKAVQAGTLALLAAGAVATTNLPAQAQSVCPARSSIFGTIVESHPGMVTIHTSESRIGDIHVVLSNARVHTNGLALRPGVYAGVYGCLEPARRSFVAEDVTLATSANTYNGYRRHETVLTGRVDDIRQGRILLDSGGGHGDVWVYLHQDWGAFRRGEHVRVHGSFDPNDSAFVANSIERID